MMNVAQGSGHAEWHLAAGEARALAIGPGPRLLHVSSGTVWLTERGAHDAPADDIWLREGETVALDDGAEVLVEGWPEARFRLLVPPCTRSGSRTGFGQFLFLQSNARG